MCQCANGVWAIIFAAGVEGEVKGEEVKRDA